MVPVARVIAGIGEVAGECPWAYAHMWGYSVWLEAGQVALPTRTGVRGGQDTGGHALRRRRKDGEGRARQRRGWQSWWW